MKKEIFFTPAFDKRHPDPKQNYGIGAVSLFFVLIGPDGAVQFKLITGWHLPEVQETLPPSLVKPMPADLGYHSRRPMYEGHDAMGSVRIEWRDPTPDEIEMFRSGGTGRVPEKFPQSVPTGTFSPCDYLDGAPCYYDGSTLNAEPVFEVLLREGHDGVWRELEAYYDSLFNTNEPKLEGRDYDKIVKIKRKINVP